MLWSVFWGLLRLLFVHGYSTYIPASCRLRLAVVTLKSMTYGALANGLRSMRIIRWKRALKFASEQHKCEAGWLERHGVRISLFCWFQVSLFFFCFALLLLGRKLECTFILRNYCTFWGALLTLGAQGKLPLLPTPPSAALLSYIWIYLRAAVSYSNLIVFLMHTSFRRTCWRNSGRPLEGRMRTYSTATLMS